MNFVFHFVLKHGYSILFAAMFVHQIGVPLPGPLFLLAAGALIARGTLGVVPGLTLAVIGAVLADWVWYEAGRKRGDKVLHFIHSFTPEPDFHDRRAKQTFARYGLAILLVSKFVPGLDAVSPPLAGTSRTGRLRFLAFDAAGATFYSVVYGGVGYLFSHDLDRAAVYAGRIGGVFAGLILAALLIYVVRKLTLRTRLATDLRRGRALLQAAMTNIRQWAAPVPSGDRPSPAFFPVPCPSMTMSWREHGMSEHDTEIDHASRSIR